MHFTSAAVSRMPTYQPFDFLGVIPACYTADNRGR